MQEIAGAELDVLVTKLEARATFEHEDVCLRLGGGGGVAHPPRVRLRGSKSESCLSNCAATAFEEVQVAARTTL
jgi:hypothetical protein